MCSSIGYKFPTRVQPLGMEKRACKSLVHLMQPGEQQRDAGDCHVVIPRAVTTISFILLLVFLEDSELLPCNVEVITQWVSPILSRYG